MKKIILALSAIMLTIGMSAQYFAPIGAKWHYTKKFDFSSDVSYSTIESFKDTLIKGKNCHVLKNNGSVKCGYYKDNHYVYYEDSIVYFYIPELDTFQILYNFNVKKDSFWSFIIKDEIFDILDTIAVNVDSTAMVNINSNNLKKLYVTYESLSHKSYSSYKSEIIEVIGDIRYLFNIDHILTGLTCDGGSYSEELRCYQDSHLGFYSTNIADSCTYTNITSIDKNNYEAGFEIYPNPITNQFEIVSDYQVSITAEIYDIFGKIVTSKEFSNKTRIDLTKYPDGIYLLVLKNKNGVIGQEKIIKK